MFAAILALSLLGQAAPPPQPDLPFLLVNHDNFEVTASARVVFVGEYIADPDNNGVVHVTGDNITIDLANQKMRGASRAAPPESYTGIGIVVKGKKVTLRNGSISGFRCGVQARECDGSTFEKLDVSDNYAMHLLSTREAEDGADWLWPHDNDKGQWVERYGAGLCIERSNDVTVREVVAKRGQNGIILDRVSRSRVYDNDCSFLSGWGLAMWRSSENVICRNAFDFCIRGYSHGVYNRGQDSAGILMFEQCSRNIIALNSLTHGGDGIFGYAGHESLGDNPPPADASGSADFYKRRGCNDNKFFGNDLSFAAAHGLEMTFSFGNQIVLNRLEGNGICGVWAGYSCDTLIAFNTFAKNVDGSIDIEHGARNVIISNEFSDDQRAINLRWEENAAFLTKPWGKANGAESSDNAIIANQFTRCGTAASLRGTTTTLDSGNSFVETPTQIERDEKSAAPATAKAPNVPPRPTLDDLARGLPGTRTPVGARAKLGGREAIRMTAYGPWDGSTPLLTLDRASPNLAYWKLIGAGPYKSAQVLGTGALRVGANKDGDEFWVNAEKPGWVSPYELRVGHANGLIAARGCIIDADWAVTFFPSPCDPRQDIEMWRAGATGADSVSIGARVLDFKFGSGSPSALKPGDVATDILAASKLPADGFGTIAKTKVSFPKGRFTIRVLSDDGVRVKLDGKTIIDDWTWHAPRESRVDLVFDEAREVEIEVEHFELDGYAVLSLFVDGDPDLRREQRPKSD